MNFKSPIKMQTGAVLLAVLIVTVILSLLIAGASVMLDKRMTLAISSKALLAQKMLAESVRSEITYLLATQRITRAGVSQGINPEGAIRTDGLWVSYYTGDELRVDGYKYQRDNEHASIRFSIQAQNGLIPVNSAGQFWLKTWLISIGVDSFDATKFTDTLADYADEDDWTRPLGAESRSYIAQGLPAPSNFLLQHCGELQNIIRWRDSIDITQALTDVCSLRRNAGLNINAIPSPLLRQLWPQDAQRIIAARDKGEWLLNSQVAAMTIHELAALQDAYMMFTPGSKFTLNLIINERMTSYDIHIGLNLLPPFTVRPMK